MQGKEERDEETVHRVGTLPDTDHVRCAPSRHGIRRYDLLYGMHDDIAGNPTVPTTVASNGRDHPASPPSGDELGGLALTGADIGTMAVVGAGALVLGGLMVRRSRRRHRAALVSAPVSGRRPETRSAMSVAVSYRSWGSTGVTDAAVRACSPAGGVSPPGRRCTLVFLLDAVLVVVVAAALGLPLRQWWTWAAVAAVVGAVGAHRSLPPPDHPERGPRSGTARRRARRHRSWSWRWPRCPDVSTDRLVVMAAIAGRRRSSSPGAPVLAPPRLADTGLVRRADAVRRGRRRERQHGGDARRAPRVRPAARRVPGRGRQRRPAAPALRWGGHAPHGAVGRAHRPRHRGLRCHPRVGDGRRLPGLRGRLGRDPRPSSVLRARHGH